MNAKATTTKAVKDATSSSIVEHNSLLTNEAKGLEFGFIVEVADLMTRGVESVRSVKSSIKEAQAVTGNAPTIRPSHVQHFITASLILSKHENAQELGVSELLKLAERFNREQGSEEAEGLIADSENLEEVQALAPTQATSRAGKGETELTKVTLRTADEILGVTIAGLQSLKVTDLKVTDLSTLKVLSNLLREVAKNSTPKKEKATA